MWRVLDTVSSPAPGRLNEDAWGVRGTLAWVVDGATPLGEVREAGKASRAGRFAHAVSHALDEIAATAVVPADLRGTLATSAGRTTADPSSLLPASAAVGVVQACGQDLAYALLADIYVVVGRDADAVVSDRRMESVTAEAHRALAMALADGASFEEARRRTERLLIDQRRNRMNQAREDAYWALTTDPATADHAVTGRVARVPGEPVLVCSDGFARLVVDAGAYGWADLMRAAMHRGLAALVDELRLIEARAPGRDEGFLRLSVHDDATAVLLG